MPESPLDPWIGGVSVRRVLNRDAHCLHAYFNTCPESPDGRRVLVYVSERPDAQVGEVRIIGREGGAGQGDTLVVAEGVTVEDAHRQAYQQWVCGGRCVVWQELRGGRWVVEVAHTDTGRRELCEGRQLGWGQPHGSLVPLHGPHWDPGKHRDLELLDVVTGEVRTALRADDVAAEHAGWVARNLGEGPVSIFFPVLSPDLSRVFFKLSTPVDGIFRSPDASRREGLFVYDLGSGRCLHMRQSWGHPAWHPDSRHIITTPNVLVDVEERSESRLARLPVLAGSHPSLSPDGRLVVSDTRMGAFGGPEDHWGVALAALDGERWHLLRAADVPGPGTTSWRPPHPHPVFSADGRRVYFNLNAGEWTALHVAQRPA